MTYLPVAGKVMTLLFTAAFLVACSGSATREAEEAAAAEAAAAEAEASRQLEEAQMRSGQEAAEQQRLEDAILAVGNVFYFDYDSSTLQPQAQEALDAHIELLRSNERNIRLDGHTDERGTREYNLALGERRANAVRDYMVVNGIASYRIETVSYGEEQPVAFGSGENNWAQNRRVELN